MRLRLRFFIAFILIIFITLLAVDVFARQNTEREVRTFLRRGGIFGAEDLVSALEKYYQDSGNWIGVTSLLESHGTGTGGWRWNDDSRKGAGGRKETTNGKDFRLADQTGILLFDPDSSQSIGTKVSENELSNAVALQDDGEVIGYLLPESGVHFPGDYEGSLMDIINHASFHAAVIAGVLSFLLAVVFSYFLLRPINQLIRAAAGLAKGDLSQRVNVKGKDELATLGEVFNSMASSLEAVEKHRKALMADIAHELRTPLAVQRANLEAIIDGVYPMSIDSIDTILEQTHLLIRLVEDLRILALADAGELSLRFQVVDLDELIASTIERFKSNAVTKHIQIHYSCSSTGLEISIDPERIQQILHNLLQNSLRHTPEGGEIKMKLRKENKYVILDVHDSGEGIPDEALPHVFERFYRVDRSRSRGEGGTGLGLTIARQLAWAHAGTLEAANHPDGGAIFSLSLPLK